MCLGPSADRSKKRTDRKGEQRRGEQQANGPRQRCQKNGVDCFRIVRDRVPEIEGSDAGQVISVLNPDGLIEPKLLPVHPADIGDASLDTPPLGCLSEQLLLDRVLAGKPWCKEAKSCRDPDDKQEEHHSPKDINCGHVELIRIIHHPRGSACPGFGSIPPSSLQGTRLACDLLLSRLQTIEDHHPGLGVRMLLYVVVVV